jgi:hypothetical protein
VATGAAPEHVVAHQVGQHDDGVGRHMHPEAPAVTAAPGVAGCAACCSRCCGASARSAVCITTYTSCCCCCRCPCHPLRCRHQEQQHVAAPDTHSWRECVCRPRLLGGGWQGFGLQTLTLVITAVVPMRPRSRYTPNTHPQVTRVTLCGT